MKKSVFIRALAALFLSYAFISCQDDEPEELTLSQSIATVKSSGFLFQKDDSGTGTDVSITWDWKKTDNLSSKVMHVQIWLDDFILHETETTARTITFSQPALVMDPESYLPLQRSLKFVFWYDENNKVEFYKTPDVPSVKKLHYKSVNDGKDLLFTWDNSDIKDLPDFIENYYISLIPVKNYGAPETDRKIEEQPVQVTQTSFLFEEPNPETTYSFSIYSKTAACGYTSEPSVLTDVKPGQADVFDAVTSPLNQIPTTQNSVVYENARGMNFYLIKTNTTEFICNTSRYVTGFSTENSLINSNDEPSQTNYSSRSISTPFTHTSPSFNPEDQYHEVPYIDESEPFQIARESDELQSEIFADTGSSGPINYKIGDTRIISVADKANKTFTPKTATLRATGEHCYAWIVDDYYSKNDASGNGKISTNQVKKFVENFEKIYALERYVFGNESSKVVVRQSATSTWWSFKDINTYSETGSKINIVFYDIDGDTGQTNWLTYGFFSSSDYGINPYAQFKGNGGHYLHIDTFAATDITDKCYGTLAHEFQHLIHFGVKYLDNPNRLSSSDIESWFTEMCSMLCEDMLLKHLNLPETSSPWAARTKYFNSGYSTNGFKYWDNSDNAFCYGRSYILGAWLARKYGGAQFVKDMMDNTFRNMDALMYAVNKQDPSMTKDTLLRDFAASLLYKNKDTAPVATVMNDGAQTLIYNENGINYSYPMTGFNLYDYVQSANETSLGPIFDNAKNQKQRPVSNYGFTIGYIEKSNQDQVNIELSQDDDTPGYKTYIIAVPVK